MGDGPVWECGSSVWETYQGVNREKRTHHAVDRLLRIEYCGFRPFCKMADFSAMVLGYRHLIYQEKCVSLSVYIYIYIYKYIYIYIYTYTYTNTSFNIHVFDFFSGGGGGNSFSFHSYSLTKGIALNIL